MDLSMSRLPLEGSLTPRRKRMQFHVRFDIQIMDLVGWCW